MNLENEKTNYVYKVKQRGLCCELNCLLGFYESVVDQNCLIYIDASASQYFKNVSIYDVFNFPDIFVDTLQPDSTIIDACRWSKSARKNYITTLTKRQCTELFTYTDDIQKHINTTISKLSLPQLYNCFHIRRGDKIWETQCFEFIEYINATHISTTTNNNLFIMTDDYNCIKEGRDYFSKNNILSNIFFLTGSEQTGHSTVQFNKKNKIYSHKELVQFFSEIEISKQSQHFIGTKTSNIYRYIKNQCTTDAKFTSLD